MSILRNLGPALSLFLRQAWQTFEKQPKLGDFVPEFPLRCQHCDAPIRLVRHPGAVTSTHQQLPAFADRCGFYRCCPEHQIPHKPMPSVL